MKLAEDLVLPADIGDIFLPGKVIRQGFYGYFGMIFFAERFVNNMKVGCRYFFKYQISWNNFCNCVFVVKFHTSDIEVFIIRPEKLFLSVVYNWIAMSA